MEDRLRLIGESSLFTGLAPTTVARIAEAARPQSYAPGDFLFRNGEPRTTFYLIVRGRLELLEGPVGGAAGEERLRRLVTLGPGDEVGEASLLHVAQHSSSARALTALEVLALPAASVRAVLTQDAGAAIEVLTRVSLVIALRLQYSSTRDVGRAQVYRSGLTRREHDLLGERDVPADALYGVQTLRGVENFAITGIRLFHYPIFVRSLALVKLAAARANARLGLLPPPVAAAIERACLEIDDGHMHGHFVVDMIQGGAGTSTNMNANEVIANRALEILGRPRGDYEGCHPNNHVNLSQSTNDVYPTAIRITTVYALQDLLSALEGLRAALAERGEAFRDVLKMGRTQLQDAVPMTLGQEFTAFAVTTEEDIARLRETARLFLEVNLGGTAIGTSINADPRYPEIAVEELRRATGLDVVLAANLVEATPDMGAFVMFSGTLKRVAVKLSKMCNDLRLLSSGPRAGLYEISLPAMQPGSSIMPGKVNPVIPEVVNQVAFQVIGNDLTITLAAEAGQLQLNVMEPVIAFNIFQSLDMLAAAVRTLTERCIRGIRANREHCRDLVERSIGVVTALVPTIGYERASEVASEALETGRSVRSLMIEKGYLSVAELDELLSPESMTQPRSLQPLTEDSPA